MTKVVINSCYGGFSISDEGFEYYLKLKGVTEFQKEPLWEGEKGPSSYTHSNKEVVQYDRDIERDDFMLVKTVEDLGKKANGEYANLRIVEIPDEVKWEIDEYDGFESVEEQHRRWS